MDIEAKAEAKQRIIRIVEEGAKSEYWQILKAEVEEKIKSYDAFIRHMDSRPIKSEDLERYNSAKKEREFIRSFLNINEIIVNKNLSFFERMKSGAADIYQRAKNYVG